MDGPLAWVIGGAVVLQVLQTIQIAIVRRDVGTVAKSIMPPSRGAHDLGVAWIRCERCGRERVIDGNRDCPYCGATPPRPNARRR